MDKEKLEKLSNDELMTLSTSVVIELIKSLRDGKKAPEETAKAINAEMKRRGLSVQVSRNFIRRVMLGEFDNADGIEVTMNKVGS